MTDYKDLEAVVARKDLVKEDQRLEQKAEIKINNNRGFQYGFLKMLPKTDGMKHKMDVLGDKQFYNRPGHKSGRIKGYLTVASIYVAMLAPPAAATIAYFNN